MKVVLFRSLHDGQWYFHLKSRNGKIIAQSEGYKRRTGAEKALIAIRRDIKSALIVVEP
jgi:uncharacterized protein YegP (UPF0339 family)